jgi:hypothetical protein
VTAVDDELLVGFLHRMMARHAASQLFLFGPAGEPFWAARTPIHPWELTILSEAIDLLQALEADRARPFAAVDPRRRFHVAALDFREDLYVVVFDDGLEPKAAEARVACLAPRLRDDVGAHS